MQNRHYDPRWIVTAICLGLALGLSLTTALRSETPPVQTVIIAAAPQPTRIPLPIPQRIVHNDP